MGVPITAYKLAEDLISSLNLSFERKFLLQTDAFTTLKTNTLSKEIVYKVKRGITFLKKISIQSKNQHLEQFKSAFLKRYEHQHVPLLKALDVETGIGYVQNPNALSATPFLDDVVFPYGQTKHTKTFEWSPLQDVLHQKLMYSLKTKEENIVLKDSDFEINPTNTGIHPDTIYTMVELVKDGDDELVAMNFAGGS